MPGPNFKEAIDLAVNTLVAAELRATANAPELNTPGVWVTGRNATPVTLSGDWEVQLDLVLVVGDTDHARAFAALDELCDKVAGIFPLAEDEQVEVRSFGRGAGNELPAYRYPITVITSN